MLNKKTIKKIKKAIKADSELFEKIDNFDPHLLVPVGTIITVRCQSFLERCIHPPITKEYELSKETINSTDLSIEYKDAILKTIDEIYLAKKTQAVCCTMYGDEKYQKIFEEAKKEEETFRSQKAQEEINRISCEKVQEIATNFNVDTQSIINIIIELAY